MFWSIVKKIAKKFLVNFTSKKLGLVVGASNKLQDHLSNENFIREQASLTVLKEDLFVLKHNIECIIMQKSTAANCHKL